MFPGYAEAHNNTGIVLKEAERFEEALRSYDQAIRLRPGYAEAHSNRGNVLKELGRLNEAMASYDQAIRLKPDYAEAHSNRGNALTQLKLLDDALASHDRALALRPDYAEAHNNRANVLKELGRLEEALASYDRAIALRPDYAEAYSNRGNALKEMKRVDEAMASHAKAVSLQPDYAEAYNNIGNLLKDIGQVDEAITHYEEAARLKPSFAMARYNKSLLALQRHSFREGFDLYRLRWEVDRNDRGPQTTVPQWDGSPLPGEVLLWAEQGIGDEVFFASMLSLLDHDHMKFALSADRRLHPIYQRSFPGIRLVDAVSTRTSISGDYAAQAAIGDLGHILQLDVERIARRRYPYLFADAARTARLRAANDVPEGNIVCGLSWRSGNKKAGGDRSIALSDLAPLLAVPGMTFVNLQYGDVAAEVESARAQSGADLRIIPDVDVFGDIDGLLALIDLCDVVVTIDNLTAHLAGAIGKDAVVLVPRVAGSIGIGAGNARACGIQACSCFISSRSATGRILSARRLRRLGGLVRRRIPPLETTIGSCLMYVFNSLSSGFIMKRISTFIAIALGTATLAAPMAEADDQTFGDWVLHCADVSGGEKACALHQKDRVAGYQAAGCLLCRRPQQGQP